MSDNTAVAMIVHYNYEVPGKRVMEMYIELQDVRIRILELKKAVAADLENVIWHQLTVLSFEESELGNRQYFDPSAHGGDEERCLIIQLEPDGMITVQLTPQFGF
jgi:hypothetical protein